MKQITILIGKSGCGKSYILNYLQYFHDLKPIITHTSRPIRLGEKHGKDYYFISKFRFKLMIKLNRMIEYRTYHTLVNNISDVWYYGLSKRKLNKNAKYVAIFDVQGAKDIINYYGVDNCTVIYIDCDDNIREERAKLRGSFDHCEWQRRLADDKIKFSDDKLRKIADYQIDNDGTIEDLYAKVNDLLDKIN